MAGEAHRRAPAMLRRVALMLRCDAIVTGETATTIEERAQAPARDADEARER